ncbi:competence protein CoiA family protein [Rugosimonospora africana]|uniref:Competence protein CoiA nuclease-like domain-containing protein n=1 Tax=Rugosimonospora africana TaxID=556532 RepID=A0A8J3R0E9_9ACTN|nr:competence protein CoiA family protein [Rugosimonospora africana]GIH20704.1 hypothetical protein Raf01_88760 [Rugosimonospora africana]
MPLVAEGLGGLIDATLPDLGLGASWQDIYRMRPRVPLVCQACRGSLHAKVSPRGLRFFAHDAARRDCPLAGESIEHRLLKSAIAAAVRMAGWHAALEVTAPDRRWRADVLATSPDGARRVAWEAQLARQHDDDTMARTAGYAADGVEVVWVFERPATREVPAITVDVSDDGITVAEPLARLITSRCESGSKCVRYRDLPHPPQCVGHGRWGPATLVLDQFVALVCRDEIRWSVLPPPEAIRPGYFEPVEEIAWTSPVYVRRAEAIREVQRVTDASVADERHQRRRRHEAELRRRQQEADRHEANRAALRERQHRLTSIVVQQVTAGTGQAPWTLPSDFEHATGVSVIVNGGPVAVICPIASRIDGEIADRLLGVTVYVASERERRAIAGECHPGQRIVVISQDHQATPPRPADGIP